MSTSGYSPMPFDEFGRDYPTHPRRCRECGTPLAFLNLGDLCLTHQVERWRAEQAALFQPPQPAEPTEPTGTGAYTFVFPRGEQDEIAQRLATIRFDLDALPIPADFDLDPNCWMCCDIANERMSHYVRRPHAAGHRCDRHRVMPPELPGLSGLEGGAA